MIREYSHKRHSRSVLEGAGIHLCLKKGKIFIVVVGAVKLQCPLVKYFGNHAVVLRSNTS